MLLRVIIPVQVFSSVADFYEENDKLRIIYWKTLQRRTFSFLKISSNNMNRLCEFVNGTWAAYISVLKSRMAMSSLC